VVVCRLGIAVNGRKLFALDLTFIELPSCVAAGRVWQELQKKLRHNSVLLLIVLPFEKNLDRPCIWGLLPSNKKRTMFMVRLLTLTWVSSGSETMFSPVICPVNITETSRSPGAAD
jgi:hypothetical protein